MNDDTPVEELLSLSGKTVLVTGASGNIGQGIARRLHEAGATIVAHYFSNESSARDLVDSLGRGSAAGGDLSDESAVRQIFEEHSPDLVVNNAAAQTVQALGDMSVGEWREMFSANLDSAFLVTQAAARRWRSSSTTGAVVNIASIEGSDPAVDHAHYATSKAALLMFTRTCALEFGADGIRVNSVSPGLIDRDGLADDWPDGVSRWLDKAPLGRLGTPNDVADAVLFLLSPAARWVSGVNLVVDGGMSTQNKY